jgi:hypothetical protein
MNELLAYMVTNITLVLTGFATLAIALALVTANRPRAEAPRRARDRS